MAKGSENRARAEGGHAREKGWDQARAQARPGTRSPKQGIGRLSRAFVKEAGAI